MTSMEPTALGWVDEDTSTAPDWHRAQVRRLAQRLGYRLVWPDPASVLHIADQVRNTAADAVIMPAPDHLDPIALARVMDVADVETVSPRLSYARWTPAKGTW
jgi:hypothetical protein